MVKVQALKKTLLATNAKWSIQKKLLDTDEIPKHGIGGSKQELKLAEDIPRIDFKKEIKLLNNNPYLIERRITAGIISAETRKTLIPGTTPAAEPAPPPEGGVAASVDWRKRWGWPWITSIRDQNGCNACWAFAAVALVEAMTRIEHAVWTTRSEGDVHKGMNAVCASLGGSAGALDWIKTNGIADPDCFPWTTANIAYAPTTDRAGRTVKIPGYKFIGNINDQKQWIDNVGPIVTFFEVWTDFFAYGSGVYQKQAMIAPNKPNKDEGGHYMLIVGYDDAQGCWIVKNSWGTDWGENGYARIAYGQCDIDKYSKIALEQHTNPDPWTKRRVHNGNMIESGNGALHRNFEMVATYGNQLRHWWRDNSVSGFPWAQVKTFGNDAAACPTFIASTFDRNFELIYPTINKRLHHWWFNQAAGQWTDFGVFGPTDVAGIPGFIQSNYNAPGNFEVVVRTADGKLAHWYRVGGSSWYEGIRFGTNIAYSGASLIQSIYGNKGNFELVCVLNTGQMQHWWRNNDSGMTWNIGASFGSGISSPPCMIEGQFGASDEKSVGNFELCVAYGGKVQHWWRDNKGGQGWKQSATFGHDVASVVALLEGSYGFNLEVIVLRTDKKLQHYYRAGNWYEGAVIGST
jgi:hypothetical protein